MPSRLEQLLDEPLTRLMTPSRLEPVRFPISTRSGANGSEPGTRSKSYGF